jgi:Reverse transcriptase (RNA-dependent DNA polymerase)
LNHANFETNLEAKGIVVDVETAFLHGDLQEEIYMNIPEGMNSNPNDCLLLTKTIYGLVQSAREFYKKVLEWIGFKENKSDPCLLSKWSQNDILIIGIYIDDCLVIGKELQINQLIVELKENGFSLRIENNLNDYLSCCVIEDEDMNQILILQLHTLTTCKLNLETKMRRREFIKPLGLQGLKLFP